MISARRASFFFWSILAAAALLISASCTHDDITEPTITGVVLAKGGASGPTVEDTDPPGAPQDTTLDVLVLGSGFDNGSEATFLLDGLPNPKVSTNSTHYVSRDTVVANVTVGLDADTALYDVQVMTRKGKKGIGVDLFMVVEKGDTVPGNPTKDDVQAIFEYPIDDATYNIRSDRRSDFLTEDGQSVVYEGGVCGVYGKIFSGPVGSGDAVMDPDYNNILGKDKKQCGEPRSITIIFDTPADSDPPPDEPVLTHGSFNNMHELWDIEEGDTVETAAGIHSLRFKPEPDHNPHYYPGSDKVLAFRENSTTWHVWTKPYPDNKAWSIEHERFYHMPFRLTVRVKPEE